MNKIKINNTYYKTNIDKLASIAANFDFITLFANSSPQPHSRSNDFIYTSPINVKHSNRIKFIKKRGAI